MADNYAIIRNAIKVKNQITARYNGYYREMCPHVIGLKKGTRQCLFYQFGGTSSSELEPTGSPNNWRCIPVDKMEQVRSRHGRWHTAPDHTRPQTCVDEIDVEVRY